LEGAGGDRHRAVAVGAAPDTAAQVEGQAVAARRALSSCRIQLLRPDYPFNPVGPLAGLPSFPAVLEQATTLRREGATGSSNARQDIYNTF